MGNTQTGTATEYDSAELDVAPRRDGKVATWGAGPGGAVSSGHVGNTSDPRDAPRESLRSYSDGGATRNDDEETYDEYYTSTNRDDQYIDDGKNNKRRRGKKLQLLVDVLNQAAVAKQSLSQFEYDELHNEVNHENEGKHDDEIEAGLATALCRLLEAVLIMPNTDKEVAKICVDLELVYRCSDPSRDESFEAIGLELVHLILQVLDRCVDGTFKREPEFILKRVIKVFGYFALLKSARVPMANNTGMLDGLVKVVNTDISSMARVDAIWTISNLAFTDANRVKMAAHPGLVGALIGASARGHTETRNEAAAALMNLAAASQNHDKLVYHVGYLSALRNLLASGGDAQSRSAGALRNLASGAESVKVQLVSFNNRAILDALVKVVDDDNVLKGSERAIGALKNCVCPGTSEAMAEHPQLIETLANIASSSKFPSAQTSSALALKDLSKEINHPSPSHEIVLRSLKACALSGRETKNDVQLSEAFLSQAEKQENQIPMVKYEGLLEAIAALAKSSDPKTRENMVKTMSKLANNSANKEIIGHNNAFIGSAVYTLQREGPENEASQTLMFQIISTLAASEKNRPPLANYPGLLEAKIHRTRLTTDIKTRFERINSIMLLVPSMISVESYF
eukprot:CAMPEP_0194283136 /NCGR_PEP_ID=MMETSP0169-20130528/24728_1 /TAXON_ID=218684 /ORGANISM="Corethron pennatum, Strain L29A3" /LENGTH=627 /DNA_ID=CAMNT_0039028673 /DNA_START=163 /DNA_END=2046 /DNA_ORIENTATION=+